MPPPTKGLNRITSITPLYYASYMSAEFMNGLVYDARYYYCYLLSSFLDNPSPIREAESPGPASIAAGN